MKQGNSLRICLMLRISPFELEKCRNPDLIPVQESHFHDFHGDYFVNFIHHFSLVHLVPHFQITFSGKRL